MATAPSAEPFASFSASQMVEQCFPPPPWVTRALSFSPAPYFLNSFQGPGDEKNSKNKGAGWVLVEYGGLAVAAAVAAFLVGGSAALAWVGRH